MRPRRFTALLSLALLPLFAAGASEPRNPTSDEDLLSALREVNFRREGGGLHNQIILRLQQTGLTPAWQASLLDIVTDPEAALDGRRLACRILALGVDGDAAADLAPLLADPQLAEDVQLVFERIPDARADTELVQALDGTQRELQRGIIDTLARRGATSAVPTLIKLASITDDSETLATTYAALGVIGGPDATQFLVTQPWPASPMQRELLARGIVRLLGQHATELSAATAQSLSERLMDPALPPRLRATGLRALLVRDPTALDRLLPLLDSEDPVDQNLAATQLPILSQDPAVTARLLVKLPDFSVRAQTIVLEGLTHRGDAAALSFAREALGRSDEQALRLAALHAIEAFGNAADFEKLLKLVDAPDPIGEAAQEALVFLPDTATGDLLMQALSDPAQANRPLIVEIIARRGMRDRIGALLAATEDADRALKTELYRAIGSLGGLAEVNTLLDRLDQLERRERTAAERAIVTIGRRLASGEVSTPLIGLWDTADAEMRQSIVRMVGSIGDQPALAFLLPMVQRDDPDPLALRYFAAWSDHNVIPLMESLVSRPVWPDAARQRVWSGMRRLARDAFEHWHPDRNDFWDATLETAQTEEDRRQFIAESIDFKNNSMLEWLTSHLEDERDHDAFVEAHAKMLKALGED